MAALAKETSFRPQPETDFDEGWEEWLHENLLLGAGGIADALVTAGFPREWAEARVLAAQSEPAHRAAERVLARLKKSAAVLDVYSDLAMQSGQTPEPIPRMNGHDVERFYRKFFFRNRPVVLRGLMAEWPASRLWSDEYFRDRFGDAEVEVFGDRDRDPRYEQHFESHRRRIRLRAFIDRLGEDQESNDSYIVARNEVLANPPLSSLKTDCLPLPAVLDATVADQFSVGFWFGPKGTVTPLHHDASNILFGQVRGRKQVKLVAPDFLHRLYNTHSCYSSVDLEQVDYKSYPLMRGVPVREVVLKPGEFLFIPVCWWHWVKSVDTSISVSFQNFYFNGPPIGWEQ